MFVIREVYAHLFYMTQNTTEPKNAAPATSSVEDTALRVSVARFQIMPWVVPPIIIPLALAVAVAVQILVNMGASQ